MIQKSNTLTNLHPFWRWFARVPARLAVFRLELKRVCVSYINKKLLNASGGGGGGNGLLASHIEAVKEGEEEPVSSGPSSLLVDYGSGWKLQTVIESHGDKGGCFQLRKCNAQFKPDHEWVQCTNAESGGCGALTLTAGHYLIEWFCYMKPFNGRCEMPDEEVESGLITTLTKHHCYNTKDPTKSRNSLPEKAAT